MCTTKPGVMITILKGLSSGLSSLQPYTEEGKAQPLPVHASLLELTARFEQQYEETLVS